MNKDDLLKEFKDGVFVLKDYLKKNKLSGFKDVYPIMFLLESMKKEIELVPGSKEVIVRLKK